ncbi:MAG: histidine kinase [Steroidobacteraceae bacterium]
MSSDNALASHLQASMEVERSQLTRELHDHLGGLLVGALMDVALVESRLREPEFREKLNRAHESLRAAVGLSRNLIEGIRPTLLDNVGLFAAVRSHIVTLCAANALECTLDMNEPEPTLKPDVAIGIYRIAEEALRLISNSLRAQSVASRAQVREGVLILRISHNGSAVAHDLLSALPEFASMSHRIATLQGNLTISHQPDGVSLWSISVPVGPQELAT